MKIAILNITSGGLSGGYIKYLCSILPYFNNDKEVQTLVSLPVGSNSNLVFSNIITIYHTSNDCNNVIRDALNKFNPDVIFIPTSRYFNYNKTPVVNMVRNMEPLTCLFINNPLIEIFKNMLRFSVTFKSVILSQKVIAVSKHVSTYIRDKWYVPEQKIAVVKHGFTCSSVPSLSVEYTNDVDYLFTAGSIRPARGLTYLLHSFQLILKKFPQLNLIIAGNADKTMFLYQKKLIKLTVKLGIFSNVKWVGSLSAGQMKHCFLNCHSFVMTSLAEACPNTLIEAMSHGCPIISTSIEPMPEFLDQDAFFYNHNQSNSLLNAFIKRMNSEDNLLSKYAYNNITKTKAYSWGSCYKMTLNELRIASSL
jgi:glycosyltransferase involved in cell wall biosynthesis